MKKILIAITGVATLFFQSCKEVPPAINFRAGNYWDTTYTVSPVPATQAHNVLVEEFTGESCSNCPAAHTQLDNDVAANPAGRINVVSLYESSNAPINVPPNGANYDFRDSTASLILNSVIYTTNADASYPNLPGGGVDRSPVTAGTAAYHGSSSWNGLINSRLAMTDSLNLDVTSHYDAGSGTDTIVTTITYTQPVSTPQNLTIIVVEDSIVDYQEFPFGIVDSSYVFNDVFVGMVTAPPYGEAVLSTLATKEKGRVYQRKDVYKMPGAFKKGIVYPEHCRVIAFVNRPSGSMPDFQVLQSQQVKLIRQ